MLPGLSAGGAQIQGGGKECWHPVGSWSDGGEWNRGVTWVGNGMG